MPTIGPIQIQPLQQNDQETNGSAIDIKSTFVRSGSVGTLYDNSRSDNETNNNNRPLGNKLPALLLPPQQITGSLDDCKFFFF